ncbi:hypothetical protein C8R47DRAFT_104179 [Mycena vitilis]|nr:hypothetical protein C8R47DRAFT_104179 [Mycena vitilis]
MAYARESAYSDLKQEEFDPYQLYEKPVPPRNFGLAKRPLLSHLLGWPALVVLSQLLLQALGWGFLAAVRSRGEVALPLHMAISANENPHIVTFVATLISTVLAGCSSFLFSYALRKSMSLYLLRPVSLAALGAGVNISMRSLVFHHRHWKWPAVSLLCLIMAGIQTSAWSTLITPVHIVLSTPLIGRDIDLSSSILEQLWASQDSDLMFCAVSVKDRRMAGGVQDSGFANGQSNLGLPAAVSLLGQGFNASTRGVLTATLNDTDVGGYRIPATAQSLGPRHIGIANSYSMTQQGFTANVSCGLQNLTNTTSPDVKVYILSTAANTTWSGDGETLSSNLNPNVTFMFAGSDCPAGWLINITHFYVEAPEGEYMWAIACGPTPDDPNSHTLIMQSSPYYQDLTGDGFGQNQTSLVCKITPSTSMVRADYNSEINVTVQSVGPPLAAGGGAAGYFAMTMLTNLVLNQQSSTQNGVGGQLLELIDNVGADKRLEIVEQYVQGVVEYSASQAFRACLSTPMQGFAHGVPANITQAMNGTWNTQTMGWRRFSTGTTLWIIVPGLFMACSTLALVLVAVYRHGGEMQTHTTTFDPSDPLHLMAAAAAGGLNNVFRSLRNKDIDEGGKTNVVLGSVPGRGPALVRADEYAPLSAATPFTPT